MVEPAADDQTESSLVRPYVITGGRTQATKDDLTVETVVTVANKADVSTLGFERAKIAALCVEPLSIAEISSFLDVPLGVSRVLVTDMVSEGLLDSHARSMGDDVELIEALIKGIRSL
jgi:Protein of unknown function (DUF742)